MVNNISFIVPVYNTEISKFIRCINSIESINMSNYEILIIDDGSNNELTEKYREYLKNCKNIKFFKNDNHGVSYSRNYGIDKSTKKYVMFVDSDDYLMSDELNSHHILLNYDIILFNHTNLNCNSNHSYPFDGGKISWNDALIDHIKNDSLSSPCAKFYKLSYLKKYNIKFNVNYVQGEDTFFNLEYLNLKPTIYYYDFSVYMYDYNSNSTTERWNKKFNQALNGKYDIYYKKKNILSTNKFLNSEMILVDIENDFIDKIMHSYLLLLKLNDRKKIDEYVKRFRKEKINKSMLRIKEKIYYYIVKSNLLILRIMLRITLNFKKI